MWHNAYSGDLNFEIKSETLQSHVITGGHHCVGLDNASGEPL